MDLSLGEDQQTLRAAFAEFFDKEATVERVRAAEPLGFDQDLWAKLAGTGAVAMGLPEEAGGGGASNLDLALVAEQYGRRLAPVPFVERAAAGRVLAAAGATDLLGGVADGSTCRRSRCHRPATGGCGWCPRARWPRSSSRSTAIA